jgi:hypothetical protein
LLTVVSCNKETPVETSISNYVQTSFKDLRSDKRQLCFRHGNGCKKSRRKEDRGVSRTIDNEPKDKFLYIKYN